MYKLFIKRLMDIILSLILLPIFILIWIPIAILIKIEDGVQYFTVGKRIGKDEKIFKMYTFVQ